MELSRGTAQRETHFTICWCGNLMVLVTFVFPAVCVTVLLCCSSIGCSQNDIMFRRQFLVSIPGKASKDLRYFLIKGEMQWQRPTIPCRRKLGHRWIKYGISAEFANPSHLFDILSVLVCSSQDPWVYLAFSCQRT